jgi:hypothetical protein
MLAIGTDINNLEVQGYIVCDVHPIWVGESALNTINGRSIISNVEIKTGVVGSDNWFNPWPCVGERYESCNPYFPSKGICAIRPVREVSYPHPDPKMVPQDMLALIPIEVVERSIDYNSGDYRVLYKVTGIVEHAFSYRHQFNIYSSKYDFVANWRQLLMYYY